MLEMIGQGLGILFSVGASATLIYLVIKSDEGIHFLKRFAIVAFVLIGLTALSQLIPLEELKVGLTDFFSFLKSTIFMWDFVFNTTLFFGYIIPVSFSLLTAYWTFLAYIFIAKNF